MNIKIVFNFVVLNVILDSDVFAQESPLLLNCPLEADGRRYQTSTKQTFVIYPRWSVPSSRTDEWVHTNYDWEYRLVQSNGVEIPIDVTNWLSENKAWITLPEYGLTPGHYRLYTTATPKQADLPALGAQYRTCYFFFKALKPIVLISGGNFRIVPARTQIELNGDESFNVNTAEPSNAGLLYNWTCKQKNPTTFCAQSPISTSRAFSIPENFVEEGEEFEVTLTVTTPTYNAGTYIESDSFTQTIQVLKDAAQLEIVCQKNCPPVSDSSSVHLITFLEVKCLKNCANIESEDYEWSIESKNDSSFSMDYVQNTAFGRNSHKFIISKEVLPPGDYLVTVGFKDAAHAGRATSSLTYPGPPTVNNCNTNPRQGNTITLFVIQCSPEEPNSQNFYEIYSRSRQDSSSTSLVADGYYPYIIGVRFMLPISADSEYFIRIITPQGSTKELPITPNVTPFISNQNQPENFIRNVNQVYGEASASDSISNQAVSSNREERELALQKFRSVVNEIVRSKFGSDDKAVSDFVQDLKFRVIEDMIKAPVETVNQVLQMTDSISKLMSHDVLPESDPLLAKFTTTICKKMMNKHLELVKKDKFPLNLGEKTNSVSTSLLSCLEANTNPNFKIIEPIEQNITTEEPVFDEPVATEDYADYEDFNDDYYKNMEYLKESTFNIVNATSLSAKVQAMTTAVGEKFVEIFGNKTSTTVGKDFGKFLAENQVHSRGVVLIPSQDFADDDHPYDILMSTWITDIMWWNPAKVRVATDIANIEFWHSTCKEPVKNFTKPARVFFNVSQRRTVSLKSFTEEYVVPEGYSTMSKEDLNYKIRVRRVVLAKGQALYVQFSNIQTPLDVVFTKFKFPTIEDFDNKTVIQSNTNLTFSIINHEDYDIWSYVGVLVDKGATGSATYNLSLVVTFCIRWIDANNSWVPACKPGNDGNMTTISCECWRFSILAGYMQNTESILQEVVITELELELRSTNVIFVTLAITFGIYCLMLILLITKRKNDVYFLADNSRTDRFAYAIVIKTGFGRYASTTSNVIIKLTGTKRSSDPHVLNYPDPELRLLQKFGKDIFLLTTEHNLGDIVKIELWFDSIGPNPDWYCKDILVYDMQQQTQWYFNVRKRLAVIKGETYVILTPKTESDKKKMNVRFEIRYHTWCLWHEEDNFSYVKKLTVVLSTVLTIYVLVLVFQGLPSFEIRDGLDKAEYSIDVVTILIAFTSSFLAFTFHNGLAWCFRLSRIQYSRYLQDNWPFFVTFISWLILIILITFSVTFLIITGFWVPFNQSLIWLTSSLMGICFGIFIYESFSVLMINLLCKTQLTYNISKKFMDFWKSAEAQRKYLYRTFGERLLRPYFEHLYNPLKKTQLKERQMTLQRRRYVISELEDLVMFGIYIVTLYIVILANKDSLTVRSKTLMQELVGGILVRSFAFEDIETARQMYEYINVTLIPSILPERWYGNYVISEPALMVDMCNKYIGVARLRQQRIKTDVCDTAEPMKFLNVSCHPELSYGLVERKTFGYGWGNISSYFLFDRLRDIWRYLTPYKTGTFGTIGEFATYSGGGYVGYLGRTLHNTYANFRKFFQKFWIDHRTRSVFIEFLTYNANNNVFNSITVLFEQSATGYTFKNVHVDAVKMVFIENKVEKITVMFFFLFVTWVGMLFVKQSLRVVKKIRALYKDIWFIIDCVIILMSMISIGLLVLRMRMVGQYLETLEKVKRNEFVNYFYLFYLEEFLKIFASFLVGIATIRLWKFLRFGIMFRILERTLSISAIPILTITLAYVALILAFTLPLVLLYGAYFENINTIVRTVRLLVTVAFKAGEVELPNYVHYPSAVFYYSLYGILVKVVFLIYIIVIVMAYAEAQMEFSTEISEYTIKHYVQENMKYIPKFIKYKYGRMYAGEEEKLKIEAKQDKFVYSNCFSLLSPRMIAMKIITLCYIRKMKRRFLKSTHLSSYDVKLMLEVSRPFLEKIKSEEKEIFFKGRIKGKRIALIDEKRVLKIAEIVNLLLQDKRKKGDETVKKTKGRSTLEDCVKMIKRKQQILRRCDMNLKLALYKINNVELKFPKMFK